MTAHLPHPAAAHPEDNAAEERQAVALQLAYILAAVGQLAEVVMLPIAFGGAVFTTAEAAENLIQNTNAHALFDLNEHLPLELVSAQAELLEQQVSILRALIEGVRNV